MNTLRTASRKKHIVDVGGDTYVALTPDAFLLYESSQRGLSLIETARLIEERSGKRLSQDEIAKGIAYVVSTIERRRSAAQRDSMHVVQWPILTPRIVYFVSTRLTRWFAPNVVIAVLLCVIASVVTSYMLKVPSRHFTILDTVVVYALYLLSVIVHEFGHTTACVVGGARPKSIGFTLFFIFPAMYADVSSVWALPKARRVVVDLGGMYLQSIVLMFIAIATIATHDPIFRNCEAIIIGSMLLNCNPIMRFDGYWALADALDIPDLAREPIRILRGYAKGIFGKNLLKDAVVLLYGACNVLGWSYFAFFAISYTLWRGPQKMWFLLTALTKGALSLNDMFVFVIVLTTMIAVTLGLAKLIQAVLTRVIVSRKEAVGDVF